MNEDAEALNEVAEALNWDGNEANSHGNAMNLHGNGTNARGNEIKLEIDKMHTCISTGNSNICFSRNNESNCVCNEKLL